MAEGCCKTVNSAVYIYTPLILLIGLISDRAALVLIRLII